MTGGAGNAPDAPASPGPDALARAQAADPRTSPRVLYELVVDFPSLRPAVAANPGTYPQLLDWLGGLGDPAIDAALSSRAVEVVGAKVVEASVLDTRVLEAKVGRQSHEGDDGAVGIAVTPAAHSAQLIDFPDEWRPAVEPGSPAVQEDEAGLDRAPVVGPALIDFPDEWGSAVAPGSAADQDVGEVEDTVVRRGEDAVSSARAGSAVDGTEELSVLGVGELEDTVVRPVDAVTVPAGPSVSPGEPVPDRAVAATEVVPAVEVAPQRLGPTSADGGGTRSRKKPAVRLVAVLLAVLLAAGGWWYLQGSGLLDREPGGEVTVVAVGDGYVRSDTPGSNHGLENQLWTSGPEPALISYLEFDLPEAPEGTELAGARLRLRTNTSPSAGSSSPLEVSLAVGAFAESDLTFVDRPRVSGPIGRLAGGSVPDTEYAVPVDAALLVDLLGGRATLALSAATGPDGLGLWSREFGTEKYAPALLLDFRAPVQPD